MPIRPLLGLFGPDIVTLTGPVDDAAVAELTSREAETLLRAVDKRRREFATGRRLARRALAQVGVHGFDLLNGDDRAPIWPPDIAGSITHCDTRAVVAVARRSEVGTFGVDIEHRAGLPQRLWRMTMLPEEVAFLDAQPAAERERWALYLFSAKEALYKAQYPVSRTYMGFEALRVDLAPDPTEPKTRGQVRCTFQENVGPFPRGYTALGRYLEFEGHPVVGVHIPNR